MRLAFMNQFVLPIAAVFILFGPAVAQDADNCLLCHADASFFPDADDAARLVIDEDVYAGSVHGAAGFTCTMCHQGAAFPHGDTVPVVACGSCHGDVQSAFANSLHGYALARGNPRAPSCTSCHGTHDILPSSDPRSSTHKVRLPSTCANCHGTGGLLTDQIVKLPQSFTDYAQSVHGQGTERGIAAAASCSDCHSVHDVRGAADPASMINPRNVARTCGQCHPDIQIRYDASIHGRALQAGVTDSPTCTGCHGEHLILSPRDPEAKTSSSRLAHETCGTCHEDPVIIAKYNLEGGVVKSYIDSYHGWATRRNYGSAATCVSCHTAHSVLPDEDPASTVNPNNVVATCRACHADADTRFAASYTHTAASISANPVNRWIRNIYLVLITLIIGGMVVHNLVIMNFFMIERRREEDQSRWLLRFDRTQIIQHLLLTIAFIMLVITGFALRFPEAWWVQRLADLGMTEPVRSDLHRINAVLLIAVAISHIHYVFFRKRGRKEFRAIVPRLQDGKDLFRNLRYYTWRNKKKVEFGRYDYSQKAEYWALIWGTILMIVTGVVLWFPEQAVKVFPAIVVSISQTIHYYEAWLATLAILVWHFFFVIFHPEEYPMSWTWLTGKMSEKSVRKHHARWYEEEVGKQGGATGESQGTTSPEAESS
jgi:formate dehydrogenase gamma subunit